MQSCMPWPKQAPFICAWCYAETKFNFGNAQRHELDEGVADALSIGERSSCTASNESYCRQSTAKQACFVLTIDSQPGDDGSREGSA